MRRFLTLACIAVSMGAPCTHAYAADNSFHIEQTPDTPAVVQDQTPPVLDEKRYGKLLSTRLASVITSAEEWNTQRESGKVLLQVVIDRDGKILSARTRETPAQPKLDAFLLAAVNRIGQMPELPREALKGKATSVAYIVPITVGMKAGTAKGKSPAQPVRTLTFGKVLPAPSEIARPTRHKKP